MVRKWASQLYIFILVFFVLVGLLDTLNNLYVVTSSLDYEYLPILIIELVLTFIFYILSYVFIGLSIKKEAFTFILLGFLFFSISLYVVPFTFSLLLNYFNGYNGFPNDLIYMIDEFMVFIYIIILFVLVLIKHLNLGLKVTLIVLGSILVASETFYLILRVNNIIDLLSILEYHLNLPTFYEAIISYLLKVGVGMIYISLPCSLEAKKKE